MRKLYLLVASCVALVAFMGFSVPAQAEDIVEPDCDGVPYNNDFALNGVVIKTTNGVPGAISGLNGSGVGCGTVLEPRGGGPGNCGEAPKGFASLNNNLRIRVPKGLELQPTGDGTNLPEGTITGGANVNLAVCLGAFSGIAEDIDAFMRVVPMDECIADNEGLEGGPVEGTVFTCHKASDLLDVLGSAYVYNVQDDDGRFTTVIGPFDALAGEAGMTKFSRFTFCEYAGGTRFEQCGDVNSDPEKWTQKNGDAGGCYEVTVINNSGDVSDPVSADPGWRIPNQRIQPLGCFDKKDVKSISPWPPPRP